MWKENFNFDNIDIKRERKAEGICVRLIIGKKMITKINRKDQYVSVVVLYKNLPNVEMLMFELVEESR